MAIQRKRNDPAISMIVNRPKNAPPKVAPKDESSRELTEAMARLGVQIGTALSSSNAQHLSAIELIGAKLQVPVGWNGNWNVSITKRDALGRISEVQFRPAKP